MLYKLDLLNFIKFFWPTEYFFIKKIVLRYYNAQNDLRYDAI